MHVYSAFGNVAYNAQYLQCIRLYYILCILVEDITDDQKICCARINICHQAIAWRYGDVATIFRVCLHPQNYKLGTRKPFATLQL